MKSWPARIALILIVAVVVASVLPWLRESLAVDAGTRGVFGRPDRGSIMIAAIVALAMARLFLTIDRRAQTHVAAGGQ